MEINIIDQKRTDTAFYFHAACNKVAAHVAIYSHGIQVVCLNASHRAWRGGGKHFRTAELALAGYRSSEMKAIIQAALAK